MEWCKHAHPQSHDVLMEKIFCAYFEGRVTGPTEGEGEGKKREERLISSRNLKDTHIFGGVVAVSESHPVWSCGNLVWLLQGVPPWTALLRLPIEIELPG